jgi:hypothetical protein
MRILGALACALTLCAAALGAEQQENPGTKPPKKGDKVLVKGCLHGTALESTETRRLDETGLLATSLTYRLTGKKNVLKGLRDEHDDTLVEVTGVLKSNLPPSGELRGTQIGKSRVFIGIGTPQTGAMAETRRSIPVLEVVSYEGNGVQCRR